MKKTVLFLLLFTGLSYSQIVPIPDPVFKQALLDATFCQDLNGNFTVVDTNFDGEIEFSEAANISVLAFDSLSITNLDGIQAFFNLTSFGCYNSLITSIDLTNSPALTTIAISNNSLLTTINVSNLTQLETLEYLNCPNLSYLDVSNCSSLTTSINITTNTLTYLNAMNCSSMFSITSNSNSLNYLNVDGCTGLNNLNVWNSQLNMIIIGSLPNLSIVNLYFNPLLSNLLIVDCPNLNTLYCSNNNFTSLNLATIPSITDLNCSYNPITFLNVSVLPNLTSLSCGNTQIMSLDVTELNNLTYLWCPNNPQLQTVFAKNGQNETFVLDNNPNLDFICADDGQVATIQGQLTTAGLTSTVVNSYCSFVPGGDYNTITGTIRYDANNNGCNASDSTQSFIRMNINDGTNQGATFSNATGTYNFYTLTGNFTVNPSLENPSFFTITPASATIPFVNTNNNVATQNFCISANGVHPDLEIVVAPITPARPGFNATYRVAYKNKGNQTLSGTASLNYNDAVLDFVSATAAPTSQSTGILNWNYTNLLPFESRSYFVTLNVNTPTETPPVNIDDVLTFSSTITPVASDAFPLDNSFTLNQTVVGSFDPNEIRCLQGSFIPPSEIGNYLHYMVNFENTGNAAAENVVVKVDIDTTKYDIATLQMLNTSHPSYTRINGNKVEFIFENINLSATSGNPPVGGHGNVLFKIRSKNTLVSGNTVAKQANIYFDYNAPIDTNMAQTTFGTLNNTVVTFDESISVFPNPTNGNVTINSKFNIKTIELYDVQGRILETVIENSNESIIDVSTRQSGIYFLKITTDEGSKVEKIMKE
ncbi:DUF7619 domain-containing protein [Flavobacterium sp.]|uniref:DUF7619 domain-containing protein n=1 Tax=Flavobacterium sp. TaxID=239 RepID=UPI002B4B2DAE|nr:T9SS type A sorting domain-containing protein [Flavobacterium sp.]HLP63973.1 T9SS type A sorting domain-containing protein [Flavobacterium sp.]